MWNLTQNDSSKVSTQDRCLKHAKQSLLYPKPEVRPRH